MLVVIVLGDNHSYKVVWIKTISIRMFNNMVRTYENVVHILELKNNVISLGWL